MDEYAGHGVSEGYAGDVCVNQRVKRQIDIFSSPDSFLFGAWRTEDHFWY